MKSTLLALIFAQLLVITPALAQEADDEASITTIDLSQILGDDTSGAMEFELLGIVPQPEGCKSVRELAEQQVAKAVPLTLNLQEACDENEDEQTPTTCTTQSIPLRLYNGAAGLSVGTGTEMVEGTFLFFYELPALTVQAAKAIAHPQTTYDAAPEKLQCMFSGLNTITVQRIRDGWQTNNDYEMMTGVGNLLVLAHGAQGLLRGASNLSARLVGNSQAVRGAVGELFVNAGGGLSFGEARLAYAAVAQPVAVETAASALAAALNPTVFHEGWADFAPENTTARHIPEANPPRAEQLVDRSGKQVAPIDSPSGRSHHYFWEPPQEGVAHISSLDGIVVQEVRLTPQGGWFDRVVSVGDTIKIKNPDGVRFKVKVNQITIENGGQCQLELETVAVKPRWYSRWRLQLRAREQHITQTYRLYTENPYYRPTPSLSR